MARLPLQSLVVRATLSILAVAALVGTFYLGLGHALTVARETEQAEQHLHELLDTIERAASIACFLNDPQLANEVAEGLLANRMVKAVEIDATSLSLANKIRAEPRDANTARPLAPIDPIVRPIASPFNPTEIVGEIRLTPDAEAIADRTDQATLFIGILMLAQILVSGVTVALVVWGYVTLPLKRLARSIQGLPAEEGAELACARGHERDELGQLVRYINRLLGRLVGLLAEERKLRLELEIEERRFRSIFENAETGIFLGDSSGVLLSHNPACRRMLQNAGYAREGVKPTLSLLFGGDQERARAFLSLCAQQNRSIHADLKLPDQAGELSERWIHLTLTPIGGQIFQGVANDITERKLSEAQAMVAAMSDPLTGLLNRMGFVRRLQEQFKLTRPSPTTWVALLLVDLDRFKQVNDTYGHDAGDQVLIGVAEMLHGLVRKSDLVGRLGGDEFVILLLDIEQPEAVEKIAEKIVTGAARPYYIGEGRTARIGASVGIALTQLANATQETLFKQADEAMYQAKRAGRNAYCFHGRCGPPVSPPRSVPGERVGD